MLFDTEDKQLIIYGSPGTGKSYNIQSTLTALGFQDDNVIRVVFHQDYTYSDFVGYISPKIANRNKINYEFTPGPLTTAIERAFIGDSNVCLLIEELNRGNAAAVFGDTFQLLDRKTDGISSYPISNNTIRNYLDSIPAIKDALNNFDIGDKDILLPQNLYIICTMNTADQNVSTIDTAFKRRFKMRYLPIIFNNSNKKIAKLDTLSYLNVFDGKGNWSNFAQQVNVIIDSINADSISIPEDKKLAPFFVDELDVSSKKSFSDKVIYYLKHDVFKYNETYFTDSYEHIYNWFVKENNDIFELLKEDKS
jgi:5-methylcytosine-specific restriction protein B